VKSVGLTPLSSIKYLSESLSFPDELFRRLNTRNPSKYKDETRLLAGLLSEEVFRIVLG
jgi:hypothetical protein